MASTPPDGVRPLPTALSFPFFFYIIGVACWYATLGFLSVFLPSQVTRASGAAQEIGLLQAAVYFPNLLLLIPGGLWADRANQKTIILTLPLLGAVVTLLVPLRLAGAPSPALLLVYALTIGVIWALYTPAREAMLYRVAPMSKMPQAATLLISAQFIAQIAGLLLGGASTKLGGAATLWILGLVLLAGALTALALPATRPAERASVSLIEDLKSSVASPLQVSRELNAIFLLSLTFGMWMFGTSLTLLPVLVHQRLAGGAPELAWVSMAGTLGVLAGTAVLLSVRGLKAIGAVYLGSFAFAALAFVGLSQAPDLRALLLANFLFGLGGSGVLSLGRALVQQIVPNEIRGRAFGVYQTCIMGGVTLGAICCGVVLERVPFTVLGWLVAVASLSLGLVAALIAPIWRLNASD
jgi:MFS family permease